MCVKQNVLKFNMHSTTIPKQLIKITALEEREKLNLTPVLLDREQSQGHFKSRRLRVRFLYFVDLLLTAEQVPHGGWLQRR